MAFIRSASFVLLLWTSTFGVSVRMMTEPEPEPSPPLLDQWRPFFFDVRLPPPDVENGGDEDDSKSSSELHMALRHYRELTDGILRQLSMAHEVASRTEALLFPHRTRICLEDETSRTRMHSSPEFLSCKLERKIAMAASTLEQNVFVLEELLKPFPITVGTVGKRPFHNESAEISMTNSTLPPEGELDGDPNHRPMHPVARYIPPYKPGEDDKLEGEEEPYDTASHVITHLARDWTADGAPIRRDTHDWIVGQIWAFHRERAEEQQLPVDSENSGTSPLSPVLVPGAGMARLAFDIAFGSTKDAVGGEVRPFAVEAIDNSLVMATAACHILRRCAGGDQRGSDGNASLKVHPLAADPYVNEVDPDRRWQPAEFPEEDVKDAFLRLRKRQSSSRPRLSYLVGDFVGTYASPSKCGVYGSIATCFFLDTATNVYEYVVAIRNLLRAGGVWINLGPVQWHRNAQLRPSATELRDVLVLSGFRIRHWEISEGMSAYRHPDDITKGTRVEAYRPLKFVAVREDDDHPRDAQGSLLHAMEALRYATGRRSPGFVKNETGVS